MSFSVEQAFVGRDEIRSPLKTPAWKAIVQHVIERLAHKRCRTVKHDADIFGLVKMVRYVPGGVLRKALLIGGNFACVSFRQNVLHKGFVILIQLLVSFQLYLRPIGALPGLSFVVRNRGLAIFKR